MRGVHDSDSIPAFAHAAARTAGITQADGTKEHTMYEDPRVAAYAAAQAAAGKA